MAIPFDGEQPALMVIPHGPTQPVLTVIPHLLGTLGLPSVVGALEIPAPTSSVGRAPEEIANLRSNWDAYLNMTDDGTWLTSIVDTGPDARNMAPNKASGMGVTTFEVGADAAARLPGNPLVTNPDSHPSSMFAVAGVNDFSIMATIPTEFEPTTGASYFTWRMATGGLFGLIINKGSNPEYIRVQGSNGTTTVDLGEVDIGINSSNGAGATAILFVRRTAGVVRLDAWYDKKLGDGVQCPEQRALVDVLPTPIPVTSQHLAGRGSITQPWQGDVKAKFHQLAWWDRAIDYEEVVDLAKYMGLRCAIEGIEAAPAPALGILSQGGAILVDATATPLSFNADDYYTAQTLPFKRLSADEGYPLGAEVGTQRVYGIPGATIVGDITANLTGGPKRRAGFRSTDADYATLPAIGAPEFGFLALTQLTTTSSGAIFTVDGPGSLARVLLQRNGAVAGVRILSSDGVNPNVISSVSVALATDVYIGASYSFTGGTQSVAAFDAAGVLTGSDTEAVPFPADATLWPAWLGRHYSSGAAWGEDVELFIAWVGYAPSVADMTAAALAHANGATTAELQALVGPWGGIVCDGVETGVFDADNPTELYTSSGVGLPVIVADPALPPPVTTRMWGLTRASGGDYIQTDGNVGLVADMTVFCLADVSALGAAQGTLLAYGWTAANGDTGFHLRFNPASGHRLEMLVSQAGTTAYATAIATVAGSSAPALPPKLFWGRIAGGVTAQCGYGDPATEVIGTAVTVAGGVDTAATKKASLLRNYDSAADQQVSGSVIGAVLNRAVSDAEITALHADPSEAAVRAAVIAFLITEEALGNVLWWPAPHSGATNGNPVTTIAQVPDESGNQTNVLTAGSSRMTIEP